MADPELEEILKNLKRRVPFIRSVMVVNSQGVFLASLIDTEFDKEALSTMSAAISALGETVLEELKGGKLEEVFIKGKDRLILITSISEGAFLFIVTDDRIPFGLLRMEVKRTKMAIKDIDRSLFIPKDLSKYLGSGEEEELLKFIEQFSIKEENLNPEEKEESS